MVQMVRTWWGEKFLDALINYMDLGRLKRGRSYSGPWRLKAFEINGHQVTAKVRGNANPYFGVYTEPTYEVQVSLKTFSKADWERVTKDISNHAATLSQLMLDEMPPSIEKIFAARKLRFLPEDHSDIESQCSCPDWASTCKHVAGVYYKIASLLDRDPLLLFQLRGMNFDRLREALATSNLGQALIDQLNSSSVEVEYQSHLYPSPEQESNEHFNLKSFWQGTELVPEPDRLEGDAVTPAILIKKGGDLPKFWHHNQSFIQMMEPIYTRIVDKNRNSL